MNAPTPVHVIAAAVTALVKYINLVHSVQAHAQEQSNSALKRDRLTN